MIKRMNFIAEERVRFNRGYHDAFYDFRNSLKTRNGNSIDSWIKNHFDNIYIAGYKAGISEAKSGNNGESSENAWSDFFKK